MRAPATAPAPTSQPALAPRATAAPEGEAEGEAAAEEDDARLAEDDEAAPEAEAATEVTDATALEALECQRRCAGRFKLTSWRLKQQLQKLKMRQTRRLQWRMPEPPRRTLRVRLKPI